MRRTQQRTQRRNQRRTQPRRPRPAPLATALALLALGSAAPPAAAWEVRDDAPAAAFGEFHRRFAFSAYHFPRREAAPLGLTGFEIYVDLAADRDFDEQGFYPQVVDGGLPGGTLGVARVGVRKGLPGNVDLGLAYGQAIDGDLELLSADVLWAFVDGGAVTPALALRLTATRSLGGSPYELEQYGGELMISKGFPVLTLYGGVGWYSADGTLDRSDGGRLGADADGEVYYAGVIVNLVILPKLTFEAEQGEAFQVAAKIGIGF